MILFLLLGSFFCELLLFYCPLSAILDGRVTPIVVENSYTFTNYEWARGTVYFKKGFSIATTATIFLDLSYPVYGGLNFNKGGTLVLLGDLTLGEGALIKGRAHIKTNGHRILFGSTRFDAYDPLIFIHDDVILDGFGICTLYMNALADGLDFKQVNNVTLKNIRIFSTIADIRIKFPSSNLSSFTLNNAHITLFGADTFLIGTNSFIVKGESHLSASRGTFIIPCSITCYGQLVTEDFVSLTCLDSITLMGTSSALHLGNLTDLHFYNPIQNKITGTGSLFINGRVSLFGQGNGLIVIDPSIDILLKNKSSLVIKSSSLIIR